MAFGFWLNSPAARAATADIGDPLLVSPAELHRYGTEGFGLEMDRATAAEKTVWDQGTLTDDASAATAALRYLRPATPSLTWRLSLVGQNVWDAYTDVSGTTRRSLTETATGLGEASFKILDRLVLGLGLGGRQLAENPGTAAALTRTGGVYSGGLLVKGEAFEAGAAETLMTGVGAAERELDLHARFSVGSAAWLSLRARKNPVADPFTSPFLTPDDDRVVYGLALQDDGAALAWQLEYQFSPAFVTSDDYDVNRHGLLASLGLKAGAWLVSLRAGGTYAHDADAAVKIPAALAVSGHARVSASGLGTGLALSRSL